MKSLFRHRLVFWPLVALLTFFFVLGVSGVFYFTHEVIHPVNLPNGIALGVALSNVASALAVLTVVVPLYARWQKRPPRFQQTTWKTYAFIAALTALVYLIYSIVLVFVYWIPLYRDQAWPPERPSTLLSLFYYIAPTSASCLLYYWLTRERSRTVKISEQEYELMQLSDLKTRAELDALQAKINPHFLYNALNSIASLVPHDPERAERMTMLLSKFYRYATTRNDQYFDTLDNELDMVQTYLDVEKVRFDERLEYQIELESESLREVPIPRFLLQPLVENAIKHGISKRAGRGTIRIRIGREGGVLVLRIHDNGPPFPDSMNLGYGLRSIQDKLRLLCGADASLDLVNGEDKHVEIRLPPQESASLERRVQAAVSVPD